MPGRTADGKVIYLWQRNGQEDAPLLRELGRLREIAFRAVGEGSGKRRDVDGYDDDYLHLILWDEEDLEIVGAIALCRPPCSWKSAAWKGSTATACSTTTRMDDILQHGIELGRSFIQPRYWGRRGLDYLWSGIGAYLARYPHYRYLFGPVSISGGCRPRRAICWWRSTACGSRRRIRWRSRVALIRPRCPMCWRSLAGKITTTTWRG
jgi:hypothetical protein